MVQALLDDLKREFSSGHMVTKIIIWNVVIFFVVNLLRLLFMLSGTNDIYVDVRDFFLVSNDPIHVLTHPWSFITSNFIHEGLGHIFWNMWLFYMFGKILGDLIGDRKILPLYLLSGIVGCLFYFLFMNMPFFGEGVVTPALGASASVMGIIMAAGFTSPHYKINLLLIGSVKLMYVSAVLFFIDIIALAPQAGGPIAHIGGGLFGGLFVYLMRNGTDLSDPVNNFIERIQNFAGSLRSDEPTPTTTKKTRTRKNTKEPLPFTHQERVDQILEKIKASGYESLTDEEKEFLFLASKK